MIQVFRGAMPLYLGVMLLMVGNGLQASLLGIRGGQAAFTNLEMSLIVSAYFGGFLMGSRFTPTMIGRVGHVRVFAALGSVISAVLILYPIVIHPWAWLVFRLVIGFGFSGLYVTAESWLNDAVDNARRGQALSLYAIMQMAGMVMAQLLLSIDDPTGFILFIIPSILVSFAIAPILLSVTPTPAFEQTKRMGLKALFQASPLGCVGVFLLGGVFSAVYGMASVYGAQIGLSLDQLMVFLTTTYVGALCLQFPIGWLSDRMDRRRLIMVVSGAAAVFSLFGFAFGGSFALLLVAGFMAAGLTNPLYALVIAHANDFLDPGDMAAASGGMLFLNGLGAIGGPLVTGLLMDGFGPRGFWLFIAGLTTASALYAAYRMTRRAAPAQDTTGAHATILPTATPVAAELAQEVFIDGLEDDAPAAPGTQANG